MSSEVYPMAIVCDDAANEFMENNDSFVKVSKVFEDANVVLKRKEKPKKIGVTENKNYLVKMMEERYGLVEFEKIIQQGLPYSLESNRVDAIVVDISKIRDIKGEVENFKDPKSFVLVARKDFIGSKKFKKFKKEYNKKVEDFNSNKKLREKYLEKEIHLNKERQKYWKTKVLPIK